MACPGLAKSKQSLEWGILQEQELAPMTWETTASFLPASLRTDLSKGLLPTISLQLPLRRNTPREPRHLDTYNPDSLACMPDP